MPYTPLTRSVNADSVLLGLGILALATLPASSPFTFVDVGYLKGCAIAYNRELRDFESAGLLVKRLVFRDRLTLTADFAEVSISNLSKMLPGSSTVDTINFGGSRTITRYAIRFEHIRSDNKFLTIDMFQATPAGEVNLQFDEEEFITYPTEFAAEVDPTKPEGQQYGRIRLHNAVS